VSASDSRLGELGSDVNRRVDFAAMSNWKATSSMIPESEQEATDFDWFAVDESGCIAHFATAGFKLLPRSVSASAEDLEKMTAFFTQLPPAGAGYHVEDDSFGNDPKRPPDYTSFFEMADRGLYSFDSDPSIVPGLAYYRVAKPARVLTLESLPSRIREIVSRTVLKGIRLEQTSKIDYHWTLSL
jgi:hypothetical protein